MASSATSAARRAEWTAAATDYVLERGLITLSLRPLGAALGTSDRMLLYHFGTKDELVAAVLAASNDRALAIVRELPESRDVRRAVLDLWETLQNPHLLRCQRLYVEAAALGLFGREPYASSVRASNDVWMAQLVAHFERAGAGRRSERLATLVDVAFNGILLDRPLDDTGRSDRIVADLAAALA